MSISSDSDSGLKGDPSCFHIAIIDIGFLLLAKKGINIINECTIRDCTTGTEQTYHIKCGKKTLDHITKNFSRQLKYNKDNYHLMPINHGSTSYSDFCSLLKEQFSNYNYDCILVKGGHKQRILQSILNNNELCVLDVTELGCPSVDSYFGTGSKSKTKQLSCIFHAKEYLYCTAYKVQKLNTWARSRKIQIFEAWKKCVAPLLSLPY
jgi:hypothetical protein